MKSTTLAFAQCLALLALLSNPLAAAEWGTLTGRFVYDGDPPVPRKIAILRAAAVCVKRPPVDEELLVDLKTRGVANIVVSLELKKGEKLPGVHPEYAKSEKADVRMTNAFCRFEPRVTLMRPTQTLVIGNDDPFPHNSLGYLIYNNPFNETVASGAEIRLRIKKPEKRPAMIKCVIHPWMKSWLVVREHPYVAVTDKNGRFNIRNIPSGEWTFRFWQEKVGYLSRIELGGRTVEDKKGLYRLPIDKEKVDLGEIHLNPKLFESP